MRQLYAIYCVLVPSRVARQLVAQVAALFAVALVVGILLPRAFVPRAPLDRAAALARAEDYGEAERIYWEELKGDPVPVPLLITFFDNHQRVLLADSKARDMITGEREVAHYRVPEAEIDELLARLPPDVALLGRYWRHASAGAPHPEDERAMIAAADADPPAPWTNHLLGVAARAHGDVETAAHRLDREGLYFAERRHDLREALHIWLDREDWDEIEKRVNDPRYAPLIDDFTRYQYAVHQRAWLRAMLYMVKSYLAMAGPAHYALAGVSAAMWLLFALRLGRVGDRPRLRVPLYLLSFVLGLLSVYPTMLVLHIEETVFHFSESNVPVRDAIYFVLGVGLREEVAKLLLFLPLLPILKAKGSRLDVLTCGALVGLGFAADENVLYFARGHLEVALTRFLTANFMHMAMTALCADALYDMIYDRRKDFTQTSKQIALVILMHGAYDFFLSMSDAGGYIAMAVFVLLVRMFLRAVDTVRGRPEPNAPLIRRFVQAVAVVVAASFVYAAALVGPKIAALRLAHGALGVALIFYIFVREVRALEGFSVR
jgi:hypothetical protein